MVDRKNTILYNKNTLRIKVWMHREQTSASKSFIEMRGAVEELLPAALFRIRLENDQMIVGHLSGKMRMHKIRILPGDQVKVEISPYDLTKGRIVYRF